MLRNRQYAITLALVLLLAVPSFASADMGAVSTSYNATPPAWGSGGDTTVPAGVAMRSVFGSLTLSPTALSAANATISICGGAVLENFNMPPISGNTQTWAYAFTVAGGDCYRFNNNLDPGAANRIASYNTVDVANEAFESRAHANATAATECPLTDCANNTYLNNSIRPPTGLHIAFLSKPFANIVIDYDPNSTRPGDIVYANLPGWVYSPTLPADPAGRISLLLIANPGAGLPCDGTVDVWAQDPVSSEQSVHETAYYSCNTEVGTQAYPSLSAQLVNETTVRLNWTMSSAVDDGFFQIEGNASTAEPRRWGSYYIITGDPYYEVDDPNARSLDVPLSDFTSDPTYLEIEYWSNVLGESMSCEVNFTADGAVHACGTLASATAGGNVTTFLNQTFINATAGGGIQFVPFAWGRGQGSITLGATGAIIAADADGVQVYAPEGNGGDPATIVPFGTSSINPSGIEASFGGATEMLHNGTLASLRVRAFGPYNISVDPVVASADSDATLAIQLQENGADVPGAVATWTAGEDAAKDIPLPNGSLPFLATDAFSLQLTLTSADAANDAANLYNALMGIAWNGTGNATFVNQTVFVNASGETFLPVLFGESNQNAGMGDTFFGGPAPRLDFTGTILGAGSPAVISPFPEALAVQATEDNNVFIMTRNGTFLSADIRAIGPYEDLGCCTDSIAVPSTENVSLLIEVQKNNVTLGSETWTAGEVATKTITLTGGAFVEGDNFRLVLTPSNTAPANATYFNLVEATYGILWTGDASTDDDSLYETIAHAAATYCPLSCAGGVGGGTTTIASFSSTALSLGAGSVALMLLGAAVVLMRFSRAPRKDEK